MPYGNSLNAHYNGMRDVCLGLVQKKTPHATDPAAAAMRAPSVALFRG
jgi:hypothetical protein